MMSHEERTAVHMASKSESRTRQHWPKAAVEKFLAAEVVTAKKREVVSVRPEEKFIGFVAHFFPIAVFRRPVRGM